MTDKFSELKLQRQQIFQNIVKLAYKNQLKEKIDQAANNFAIHNKQNLKKVKNEFLLAMGLDPLADNDTELATSVDAALELKEITEPIVAINRGICDECREKETCQDICINNPEEGLLIEDGRCISCGKCIPRCPLEAISDKIEFIPLVKYIQQGIPVYANVAPAIVGQFGENITPGMLRAAFKSIGFTDMVEVALFADLLTLREADEYNQLVLTEEDFMITSCCCPVWINLLTKHYAKLNDRLTKTVSPMIASGRVIKTIFPEAITVFVGPCIAKKAEAKVPELKGAIDYVLTFDEVSQIFTALEIDLAKMPDDKKEQSSRGGRIYGRTGGVSEAVKSTVERINPDRRLNFESIQANGVKECKELLDKLVNKQIKANFIEGMGCQGGCVGGPKRNIEIDDGTEYINNYGAESEAKNPVDNRNVNHILKYLNRIEENRYRVIDELSLDKILLREYNLPEKS